ncbi:penicillin binding protein PBP4B [Stenotrophomonas sp. MMGLT7]|uniref:penicillin binding protein PBP4B n=1 Tax=Stenotrophomonas sp. MMGLT7 TaxID=2901227 RepID=UPI001E599645|nr:penicillin binding protein PBP4B [Stenotrophomonas sp. MMGLT7]MCD7099970.1 penicillin binding protein PBP4B [Stenotrophomonas sp. MMGLT7]
MPPPRVRRRGPAAPAARHRVALLLALLVTLPATAAPLLPRADSVQAAGFSAAGLDAIDRSIQAQVDAGFPGAVLAIVRDGRLVKLRAYGYAQRYDAHGALARPQPMRADTIFDLASNTKMYATVFALQRLAWEGRVDVDAPVARYLPEFADAADPRRARIRVADLLRHSAGFAADVPFHDPATAGPRFSQQRARTEALLPKLPLDYPAGSRNLYSDTDFMLAGMIVERITGQRLDRYLDDTFYRPLGLQRTGFAPLAAGKGLTRVDFAATEPQGNSRGGSVDFPGIRRDTLRGQVHDEKAYYAMGQVSGHAGLFSDAEELAVLVQLTLDGGERGGHRYFDAATLSRFTAPAGPDPSYGLGWRLNRGDGLRWMFGRCASARAYGHTGWTGTLTLADPAHRLAIVLLTNKKNTPVVDPGRDRNRFAGDGFAIARYGSVVDAVYAAIDGGSGGVPHCTPQQ